MSVSVNIVTSSDNFIARKDGSIDWLMVADTPKSTEYYGYKE